MNGHGRSSVSGITLHSPGTNFSVPMQPTDTKPFDPGATAFGRLADLKAAAEAIEAKRKQLGH
jgi:hypothetical protein